MSRKRPAVTGDTDAQATHTELVALVRSIKRFYVEIGVCPVCGWRRRGRGRVVNAGLVPGQHGATAHPTGPHVMTQALTEIEQQNMKQSKA